MMKDGMGATIKIPPGGNAVIEREIGISQEKSRPGHPLEKQR